MQFRSDITVELTDQYGSDLDICRAAWVSSGKDIIDPSEKKKQGLIEALLRDKHGCYDDKTEVLTDRGWIPWSEATVDHKYATLNLTTNQIEYQKTDRIIHKKVDEPLLHFRKEGLDLLVTKNHRMVVSVLEARNTWSDWKIVEARDLIGVTHRHRLGGGIWNLNNKQITEFWDFLGFAVGDGSFTGTSLTFHLKKQRKIEHLTLLVDSLHYTLSQRGDTFTVSNIGEYERRLLKATYDENKNRCLPREVLEESSECLKALWNGLVQADGHVSKQGKVTVSTVSSHLADQLQELLLKIGQSARIRIQWDRPTSFGFRPMYVVTAVRERRANPRLNWTKKDHIDVIYEDYEGMVHCATVPNGTLYVRRNNKAAWCGNSPFEAGYFSFRVEAPRAVRDEAVRHRIASFSSSSLRYTLSEPVVYLPPRERPFVKAEGHKQIKPVYEPFSDEEYAAYADTLVRGYERAQEHSEILQSMTDSTEAVRWLTHDGTFCTFIIRLNPRSVMHFLGLRTHNKDANHVSYPMWEIAQMADQMEDFFKRGLPLTYAAWVKYGRESP